MAENDKGFRGLDDFLNDKTDIQHNNVVQDTNVTQHNNVAQDNESEENVRWNNKDEIPLTKTNSDNRITKSTISIGIEVVKFIVALVILFMFYSDFGSGVKSSHSSTSPAKVNTVTKKNVEEQPIAKKNVVTGYDENFAGNYNGNKGYCELTIYNTGNDMPVYVRLWVNGKPRKAFYVKQGESFTATELPPGSYEVRYKELYENNVKPTGAKSDELLLSQEDTFEGIRYTRASLTLYKVKNGNTRTTSINSDDV